MMGREQKHHQDELFTGGLNLERPLRKDHMARVIHEVIASM